MVLNNNALVDIQDVRMHVLRDAGNDSQDDKFVFYTNWASDAIKDYCGREFVPATGQTRTFDYDGAGYLALAPYELRTVSSITLNADTGSPQTLSSSEYRLEPRGRNVWGTYDELFLIPPLRWSTATYNFGWEISITGDWGMAAVPSHVQGACLIYIADLYRNPTGAASVSMGAYTFTEDNTGYLAGGIPPRAQRLLTSFKRNTALTSVRMSRGDGIYAPWLELPIV